ncbi:MAG TPA: cytidylate kinase-like family protein [Paludibacteraceae bacterium]|nr:cytidylate kinase-like family protein [Paludibacteraceae bacterium]HOL00520.1 cytidylate kinase-like family protein [Paludibacteraceae bacterium]HPO67353.1 cytidylate kinase-like family protein [Paludibacteraceae bacterium]
MNENFVITIGRQIGSGGHQIGNEIAKYFNIDFYDKELIQAVSKETGLAKEIFDEMDEKKTHSIFSNFLGLQNSVMMDQFYLCDNYLSNETLFKIQSEVIRKLADQKSCVFVGRCADYVLKDYPRIVTIFITADFEDRIKRIMERENLSTEKAKEYLKKMEKKRADYYNYFSNKQWGAAASYQLCINSSALGVEKTVDYLIEFIKQKLQLE